MAYDKVIDSTLWSGRMVDIADAIRFKTSIASQIDVDDMPALIRGITTATELDPLTFTAGEPNSSVTLAAVGSPNVAGILYKTNIGGTESDWVTYTPNTTVTLTSTNDSVQFKNTESTLSLSNTSYVHFEMTGKIYGSGDAQSMVNANSETRETTKGCFFHLFENCKALLTAPSLTSTVMTQSCYDSMFMNCTSLTAAPALPALALAVGCYASMFSGCSALRTAPALPATALAKGCYQYMFKGCTALEAAPELPATVMAQSCYNNMFASCKTLTAMPEISATTGAVSCFAGMFMNCTGISKAFVPAITLAENCFQYMFKGCTALSDITCMFITWGTDNTEYTKSWVANVAASGSFTKPSELPEVYGSNNIPTGWSNASTDVLVDADILAYRNRAIVAEDNATATVADLEEQYNISKDIIGE